MASSEGNGKWVVTIDPPIPGVRHTAFGPYTEEGAHNFQAAVGQNFPGIKTVAQEMADRIWGDPIPMGSRKAVYPFQARRQN